VTAHPRFAVALLTGCLALVAQTRPASPASLALHSIRTIYVGEPDFVDRSDVEFLQGILKKELQSSGFQIAEKPAAADAVLSAKFCGSVTVDGDEWDPTYPRPGYCFQLASPAGEQLWHALIYVGKGQRIEGQFREAAAVCARKFAHAWKKSAHDAGLKAARP
jgi:hypothetical protein